MTKLQNHNVLITGAASGIGRSMARVIALKGAKVILWDVNQSGLDVVVKELNGQGLQAVAYCCDISSKDQVKKIAKQVLKQQGPITVLINNAGIVKGQTILEEKDEDIIQTININTLSLFWVTRAFLPTMIDQGQGHVVTISSAGGLVGVPHQVDYGASKFAAFGFDEALRMEMKHLKMPIKTTVICPFYIDTGMFSGVKTKVPWLLPILDPNYVVDRIVNAISKNKARVIMPRFVYTVWLVRLLPVSLFDKLNDFFGITTSMDTYTGRKH